MLKEVWLQHPHPKHVHMNILHDITKKANKVCPKATLELTACNWSVCKLQNIFEEPRSDCRENLGLIISNARVKMRTSYEFWLLILLRFTYMHKAQLACSCWKYIQSHTQLMHWAQVYPNTTKFKQKLQKNFNLWQSISSFQYCWFFCIGVCRVSGFSIFTSKHPST